MAIDISAAALGASLPLASAVMAAEPGLRAGEWEIIHDAKGGPGGRSGTSQHEVHCITQSRMAADPATLLKLPPPPPPDQSRDRPQCEIPSVAMTNGKVKMTTSCQTPVGKIKVHWSGDYSPTSFTLTGKAKVFFMSVDLSMSGRYLGACSAT